MVVDEFVADFQGDFQGQGREGCQDEAGDGGVDAGAGDGLTGGDGVGDRFMLAVVVGDGEASAFVVTHAHPASASSADGQALEQSGALAGWSFGALVAAGGGVRREGALVVFELCPSQVARVVVGDQDRPLCLRFGSAVVVAVQVDRVFVPAIGVGPGVGRVVQRGQDLAVLYLFPVQLPFVGSGPVAPGERQARRRERLDDGPG